jgi:hypothetical protein
LAQAEAINSEDASFSLINVHCPSSHLTAPLETAYHMFFEMTEGLDHSILHVAIVDNIYYCAL